MKIGMGRAERSRCNHLEGVFVLRGICLSCLQPSAASLDGINIARKDAVTAEFQLEIRLTLPIQGDRTYCGPQGIPPFVTQHDFCERTQYCVRPRLIERQDNSLKESHSLAVGTRVDPAGDGTVLRNRQCESEWFH